MAEEMYSVTLHENIKAEPYDGEEQPTEDLQPFISANDTDDDDQWTFKDIRADETWEIGIVKTEQMSSAPQLSSPEGSEYEEERVNEESDSDFELDEYDCKSTKTKLLNEEVEDRPPLKHMKNHRTAKETKIIEFNCPLCPRVFKYRNSVRVHLRTHKNERPFVCPVCSTSFVKNSYLVRHQTTHLKVKPYECLLCHLRFSRRDHTRSHILRRHHLNSKTSDISKYISYQQPQPTTENGGVGNGKQTKRNMIGEPCKSRGRATGTGLKLKACSVKLSPISINNEKTDPGSSTCEWTPKSETVCKEKIRGLNHDKLRNSKVQGSNTTVKTDVKNEMTLKCMFCSEVYSSSSDLVRHYSSHTAVTSQ
ncbi:Zinc finger and SCAN domain-containing protein 4 [Orchesella cincta]|uniref:Zinc finger and SCAN domain-containing protein 4 n=1 Tax=Orchesella cincta TaxID=48709 RepID=A0A1D2NC42_ORCCI|nr:Zinc finger and SCAN domain-containing protein 4 [Orchesella cincta]